MTVSWYDGATLELSFAPTKGAFQAFNDTTDYTADISAFLRDDIRITRGRGFETDAFSTGSMTLTLDNRDRRFDPEYSAGPYFGNLLPMRPMRLRLTYAGTTSYLFAGFVREWRQGWDKANNDAVCYVTVDDGFKILANMALPESAWYSEVLVNSPTAWYRLGDEDGASLCTDSSGNGRHGYYFLPGGTGTTGLPVFSANKARNTETFTGSGSAIGQGIASQLHYVSGTTWSWECWYQSTTFNGAVWIQSTNDPGSGSISGLFPTGTFDVTVASGQLSIGWNDGTNNGGNFYNTVTINDGNRHHLAVTRSGATVTLYVDGAAVTPSSTTGSPPTVGGTAFGTKARIGVPAFLTPNAAVIDEVALYATALNATDVLNHYTGGATAWSGDRVNDRLARLATYLGLGTSAFGAAYEQSNQFVRGADFSGGNSTALAYMQMLERTENGRLFMRSDGALTLHARYHDVSQTVLAAFSDVAGTTLPYRELGHEYDDARVINDAKVTRTGGNTQRVQDATSIATYGTRSVSVDGLAMLTDSEATDRANAIVYKYKDARARFTSVMITPRAAPTTLFPQVRSLDIGQRISVRRLPVGTGSAFTKELMIEGIQHSIDVKGGWVTSYLTSPADVAGTWFVLDIGVLDTNRLGF